MRDIKSAYVLAAARRAILELGHRSPDSVTFRRNLRPILLNMLSFDAYCMNTADPATLLVTGSVGDGLPAQKAAQLFKIEYMESDYSKMSALAVGESNVAVLGDETDHCPTKSPRMREVFLPIGYGHEMRCALLVGGCCWGYLHLLRRSCHQDFSPLEARMVRALSIDIALGLRLGVLRAAAAGGAQEGPGLILFSSDGESVEDMNAVAEHWLKELDGELRDPLPHAVFAVAQRARASSGVADGAASCRVQTRAGHWLMVHGTWIGARLAIVMEKAHPDEIAPVILRAYELTPREEGVVRLLLRGMSNDEIAAVLNLSTYTIKQHLKSVFRKVDTRSRAELTARIFAEQYAPRIAERRPLAANGWFAADGPARTRMTAPVAASSGTGGSS